MEADLCIRLMHLVGILQALGSAAVTCVVYEDALLFYCKNIKIELNILVTCDYMTWVVGVFFIYI